MDSRKTRFALIGVLVAIAAALFFILQPDDSDNGPTVINSAEPDVTETKSKKDKTKPSPSVPTVVVKDGAPVDGVLGIEVKDGDQITFKVKSDVDEEIHVHGYDISQDVSAGGSARISFKADIEGIFEAELENSGVQIAELQINP